VGRHAARPRPLAPPATAVIARPASTASAAAAAASRWARLTRLGTRRTAAIASVATGCLVFAAASAASPGLGDLIAAPARPAGAGAGGGIPVLAPMRIEGLGQAPLTAVPPSVPPPARTSAAAPQPKSTSPAPATSAAISALAANGIPKVALNAYRVAAARLGHVQPGCGIDWALLAGIGRVESNHGRFGGAQLLADGTTSKKIIGPALDGVGDKHIAAPANGAALAGDSVYAHALGPMQFIPTTWAIYGADGNGDGVADVFNIDDAALAAARYLCAAGGNLKVHANQVRAVMAYNQSATYNAQVLALADAYRRGIPVSGIPVGDITGALKPVKVVGAPPPANPGAPTAVDPDKSAKPKPATSTTAAAKPAARTTSTPVTARTTPAGTRTTPATTSSGTTSAPPVIPDPQPTTSTSSPAPDPTTSTTSGPAPSSSTRYCDPLQHLLGIC
jgi:membrane-bound lytic murein transglycosylase B